VLVSLYPESSSCAFSSAIWFIKHCEQNNLNSVSLLPAFHVCANLNVILRCLCKCPLLDCIFMLVCMRVNVKSHMELLALITLGILIVFSSYTAVDNVSDRSKRRNGYLQLVAGSCMGVIAFCLHYATKLM
jgi:hypothetical protein